MSEDFATSLKLILRARQDFFSTIKGEKKLPFRGTRPSVIMPEVSKMKKPDVKVVLLGDMNVGKTSLLHRYTERKFKDTVSTVGGAFYLKQWGPYNISIWDTAGNISFMSSLQTFPTVYLLNSSLIPPVYLLCLPDNAWSLHWRQSLACDRSVSIAYRLQTCLLVILFRLIPMMKQITITCKA